MQRTVSPTTHRSRRGRAGLAALSAVLLVAGVACSSSDDSDGGADTDTAAETTAAGGDEATEETTEESTEESGEAAEGEVLDITIGSEPGSLDPLLKSDGPRDFFVLSVYEGLTTRVGDGSGSEIQPALAESWELDGTSWVFTLREGATFHNGEPVTAADVAASWNRMMNEESEHLGSKVLEDTVIEVVDDRTVSITRPVADPTTPARAALVMIAPADYAELPDDRLSSEMMGTGPYQFNAWNRGSSIELAAYDGYWGDAPAIENVNILFDEEIAVRMAALQAGEVDMALNMAPELVDPAFEAVGTPRSEVSWMRLNSQFGPFTDINVRRAADLAIDREALVDTIWGGFTSDARGQKVAPYVFGHNPDLSSTAYDPDEARRLLEEAGAVGTPIEVWGTRGRWTNDGLLGEAIVGMLNEVGFEATLLTPPFADWVEKVFVAETDDTQAPDITLYNHSNELFDASQTIGQNLICAGRSSTTCIPEVDELAQQAIDAGDDAELRQDLYNQIWEILVEDAAYVSLAEVQGITFHVPGLNWTPEPDGFLRIQNMSFS